MFHQEADGRAVRAAAEAVVELLGGRHREGRRLFIVERTQPLVVGSRLAQLDGLADHVDDIDAGQQLLDEGLRDQTIAGVPPQADRRARTLAETAARSACPASRVLTMAMTLPMSAMPAAPVSATAASMTAWIWASSACAGR